MKRRSLAAVPLSLLALSALASDRGDAPLAQSLQERLDYAYGELFAARDPIRLTDELVTEDAVIASGEAATVWHGRKACIALVKELMQTYSVIRPRAVVTRRLGESSAYQFVEFELHSESADRRDTTTHAKSLYVWTKTSKGWRVAADLFAPGAFERRP